MLIYDGWGECGHEGWYTPIHVALAKILKLAHEAQPLETNPRLLILDQIESIAANVFDVPPTDDYLDHIIKGEDTKIWTWIKSILPYRMIRAEQECRSGGGIIEMLMIWFEGEGIEYKFNSDQWFELICNLGDDQTRVQGDTALICAVESYRFWTDKLGQARD